MGGLLATKLSCNACRTTSAIFTYSITIQSVCVWLPNVHHQCHSLRIVQIGLRAEQICEKENSEQRRVSDVVGSWLLAARSDGIGDLR